MDKTVFVTLTDSLYYEKAIRTITDLRTHGKWVGPIVLITIDFHLNSHFKESHYITEVSFPLIDKTQLLDKIKCAFPDGDGREINKLNQWEKLHVFDEYFNQWSRVVFLDAGLRVVDSVYYLLELDYKNSILAPNDAAPYNNPFKIFKYQLSNYNQDLIDKVKIDFGEYIFNSQYFLNCIWIYDTKILKICDKSQLIQAMNDYPLCKTNEMAIMNLLFHFKYKLWKEFPITASNSKYLFEWSETNHPHYTNWRDYCYIKYPISINFNEP
jgi:hypothetical protein